MTLLKAIATIEGFYLPGSRAQRNNNPGNLDWGIFSHEHGATNIEQIPSKFNEEPRFAYFPNAAIGFAALLALLQSPSYEWLTVEEMVNRYAPDTENNVQDYIRNLCKLVECSPTTPISHLLTPQ